MGTVILSFSKAQCLRTKSVNASLPCRQELAELPELGLEALQLASARAQALVRQALERLL